MHKNKHIVIILKYNQNLHAGVDTCKLKNVILLLYNLYLVLNKSAPGGHSQNRFCYVNLVRFYLEQGIQNNKSGTYNILFSYNK